MGQANESVLEFFEGLTPKIDFVSHHWRGPDWPVAMHQICSRGPTKHCMNGKEAHKGRTKGLVNFKVEIFCCI